MTQADKDILNSAIEFWQKIFEDGEGKVKFTKKDGSIRIMNCTLDFKRIPKEKHPKDFNMAKVLKMMQSSGIIHVYDLDKKEWRSVPFKQVDWMQTPVQTYKIKPYISTKKEII